MQWMWLTPNWGSWDADHQPMSLSASHKTQKQVIILLGLHPRYTTNQDLIHLDISKHIQIHLDFIFHILVYSFNYQTTWCTTLRQPWYKLHSQFSKKCLALWRRIDFDISTVKIRVLDFPKTTFFLCTSSARNWSFLFFMFLAGLLGGFAQMCQECTWLTWSQHLSPHELLN